MSFALLALASRLLTSSLDHSLPPLGEGIERVALPVLSAQFELARTWLYIATGTSTNLSMCSTCVTSTVFGSSGAYLCMFTEMSTTFVDELQRDEYQRFFVDGLDIRDLLQQHHWHIDHLVTVLNLRDLDVLCRLIRLLWPLGVLHGINQSASHSASY